MTRDTKLALVVGFALVLAVGVLISDHFASGYQSPPADLVETQPAVHVRDVLGDDRGLEPQREPPERRQRPNREQARNQSREQDPQANSRELAQDVSPPTEFLLGNPEFHELAQSGPARELLPHERDLQGANVSLLPLVDTRGDLRSDLTKEDEQPRRRGAQNQKTQEPPKPERWHIVADGESLWEIAKYYYDKGSVWEKLAAKNEGRIGKDGVVRKDVRLLIPPATELGLAERALPAPPKQQQKQEPENRGTTQVASTRDYTVGKNETLSEIAMEQLGSAKRMGEIIKLNGIKNPNSIKAGTVLRLPA